MDASTLCGRENIGIRALSLSSHGFSYVAFTNKRVIITPTFGNRQIVEYKEIIQVDIETNYLQCRKEIKITKEGKPKVPLPPLKIGLGVFLQHEGCSSFTLPPEPGEQNFFSHSCLASIY